jgi:hypothetical protein
MQNRRRFTGRLCLLDGIEGAVDIASVDNAASLFSDRGHR